MDLRGDAAQRERLYAYLGLGIIIASGVLMAFVEIRHFQRMSSTIGVAVFALLPFVINLGLIGAGVALWRSRFTGHEILRIAGWVVLGMVVIGLLATWTITHQNIRGRPFAHAPFVTVNNLSAGGLIGFLMGWYDGLRRHHQKQAEAQRARLEFLHSSLRHNVLNGLNIILGNVELLEEKVDDAASGHLERIRSRGKELTRFAEATNVLMTNFLGTADTSTRPVDVAAVLTKEINNLRNQFEDVEFSVDMPEDLFIEGDDFLSELFSNLLRNAVEHNDKPTPEVSITGQRSNGSFLLTVADNGPGIPDEQKDRVLEWNVKGPDSAGTGLGLAIAKTVADRYGGTLWIEDNHPRGTAVKAELPTVESTEPNAQEANA